MARPCVRLSAPQLCCATSKDSRPACVARLTDDENPSRINTANFPDSTLDPSICRAYYLAAKHGQRTYLEAG